MATEDQRQLITTIDRAVDVLLLFTRVGRVDLGVTEISNELGLAKAVVHRVLNTLAAKGFVETVEETRRYRLGPAVISLGVTYLDHIDIREFAQPTLRELMNATNETATLSLRYGWERMYLDQVTPDREVKMTVMLGRPFPLHAGSSSKAFLAFLPDDEVSRFLENYGLEPLTDATIVDAGALQRDLEGIRRRGFAISTGERQVGAGSVAAPILDHRGNPAAVVSVCGPLERFTDEIDDISALLLEKTRNLSRRLGYQRGSAA